MPHSDTKHKTEEFAKKALERIAVEKLSLIPQNFELWYVYYESLNLEVVHAINVLTLNKQKITDDQCAEIHQRFLSGHKDNEQIREAGKSIQDTIQGVTTRVQDIKSAALHYNKTLQEARKTLEQKTATPEILATVRAVLDNTGNMIERNQLLERELENSARAMQRLQRDMDFVRKQALMDGLTGLTNRKAFDTEIERIVDHAQEEGETFCLILLDIDHFKSFNDNFGHQVGDQVLRLVSKTLIEGVKGRDTAARYGGEEFAIILPQTNLIGGVKVAESLLTIIQGKELVNRNTGDKLGRITLSGGVAEYMRGETVDSLIERADTALLTAKRKGRNQVLTAPNHKK